MSIHWFTLVLLIGASMMRVTAAIPKVEAAQQVLDIVNNPELYDKDIIPFQNKSGPIEVVSTAYIRTVDIDDVKMRTTVDLTFRVHWKDHRLSFDVPGVTKVRFADVSKFWIPDVFFKNSFRTEQMESVYPEAYIEVAKKGDILYSSRFLLHLRCNMFFDRFPHDYQNCPIDIASYGYSTKDVTLYFEDTDPVSLAKNMLLTHRFTLSRITTDYCSSKTATGEYACLRILFTLDREFSVYLLEWYLPCVSLVIIAFFSELLEPSALLARLILTVGPLLTLMSAGLKYSENLPSVSYSTCLDQFTGMSLLAIFATILHVLISHYFSLKPEEEDKVDVEGGTSRWKSFYEKIKAKGNLITKSLIIGIYFVYIFLYCLAYALARNPV